jgi:hypothetical protein
VIRVGKMVEINRFVAVYLILIPHIDGAYELAGETLAPGYLSSNLSHVHGGGLIHASVCEEELEYAKTYDNKAQNDAHAHQELALLLFRCRGVGHVGQVIAMSG